MTVDQKYKRLDRVFGLSITGSFDQFRDRLARYSPFSAKHTLFPFMVVEAKSEKSESGFHDIEQQTALSIRTCLKIQIDLEMESNQVLDPLVWFFGFRGDEWRLYVALPVNDRTVRSRSLEMEDFNRWTDIRRKLSIVGTGAYPGLTRRCNCY